MSRLNPNKWRLEAPDGDIVAYAPTRHRARLSLAGLVPGTFPARLTRRCPGVYGWTCHAPTVPLNYRGTWLVYTARGLENLRAVRALELRALGVTVPPADTRRPDGV